MAELPSVTLWTMVVVVALLMSAPILWRRVHPQFMVALIAVGVCCHMALFAHFSWLMLSVPLAVYAAARWATRWVALAALVIGCIMSVVAVSIWLWPSQHARSHDLVLFSALGCATLLISALLGRWVRSSVDKTRTETMSILKAAEVEAAQKLQADNLAHAQIRAEIARELHDVVAHSISVIVVQAEGGQAAAAKEPAKAVEALDNIANVGHEALREMRHIVGVLRASGVAADQIATRLPHPTLSDIPDMVAKAGSRVSLTIVGQTPVVSPTIHLVAYRVVQESLTNFLKHAGPTARALVCIEYKSDSIAIDVSDDGVGAPQLATQCDMPGHGIQGIRERLSSVGGHLLIGTSHEGGVRVQAWLPMPAVADVTQIGGYHEDSRHIG